MYISKKGSDSGCPLHWWVVTIIIVQYQRLCPDMIFKFVIYVIQFDMLQNKFLVAVSQWSNTVSR